MRKHYCLSIPEVIIIESEIHRDHRGYLSVPICIPDLKEIGIDFNIVQINQGYSILSNTIRGMHFQIAPYAQAKLLSANRGSYYSVAVDIRPDSPTFGKWCGEYISADNGKVMYVPRGFAHGYLTLEKDTILQYCVDNFYCKDAAKALRYDDPTVNIEWPAYVDIQTLAEKDIHAYKLQDIENIKLT